MAGAVVFFLPVAAAAVAASSSPSSSVGSTDYFINRSEVSSSTFDRYWEPHTSSIDFCETNYLLSPYVVEPHNSFSSLWGLSLFGLLGLLRGNPTNELRFDVANAVLIAIGLGSAALHATLHWAFQGADELPMIYLVVCGLYCCIEIDSPRGRPKYGRLPMILTLMCAINTAIYFAYRQYYVVFLGTFIGMLLALVTLHLRIASRMRRKRRRAVEMLRSSGRTTTTENAEGITGGGATTKTTTATTTTEEEETYEDVLRGGRNARLALRFYLWHYVAFALIAVPVWFLDQFRCPELLPLYDALPFPLKGATLHVVWHACSGLGAFLFLQFLTVCRAEELGVECRMGRAVGGWVPVATSRNEEEGSAAGKRKGE